MIRPRCPQQRGHAGGRFSDGGIDTRLSPWFNDGMNTTTAAIYNPELDCLVDVDLTDLPEWAPSLDELRADAAAAGDVEMVRTIDAIQDR